ncbi:TonB-dependent receptor plug domain-containing protein [Maribellus comscasis]|uniref:TonB-dependent receptor plug domain-containing protein n=1 Tax=Maribellus comscasis TaxID=2681766 RepID=A0A6I6JNU6_9BACT|nr:TonB-dependent receptor plug domain-containing protein [Maribellus comscasis]QGY42650.1 TonB-dependent receptor plug domain-containing protein [Maribellus comscasis]
MRIVNFFSFTCTVLFLASFSLSAQDKVIHGTVTTFDSIRLAKVDVKVKSTGQIILTDNYGNFAVQCDNDDVLVVSANGFYKQRVKLDSKIKFAAINLVLKPGPKSREHAVGYGHVSDVNRLNALSNLNDDDLDFSKYTDIYEILRGRFSGVRVVDGEVIVRGKNTFDSFNNAALIVVDGVQRDESALSNIPTDQVKSIDIIKDGSSAIYGVQGANGVVVIETKRGSDMSKK